jgi:small subunit ribosomal protein S16
MPAKIRLQRHGRKKTPFYHIVIADSRSPRDGRFIEKIGTYNPTTVPATIDIVSETALNWLEKGAQPSETVRKILSYKGILFRKHLLRGVKKGILPQETADAKWVTWQEEHARKATEAKTIGRSGLKKKKRKSGKTTGTATAAAPAPAAPTA